MAALGSVIGRFTSPDYSIEFQKDSQGKIWGVYSRGADFQETYVIEGISEALLKQYIDKGDQPYIDENRVAWIKQAESSYTNALDLIQIDEDKQKIFLCMKALAEIYVKKNSDGLKQKKKQLIQAAGMYNYCLRIASEDDKELVKKELIGIENALVRFCERKSYEQSQDLFQTNRDKLKEFRDHIERKIKKLLDDSNPLLVFDLHHEIAEQMKGFTKILIDQVIQNLGNPPCSFAVIGFGSLAREEMTPYSDLEFGILIGENSEENKQYFRDFTYLLHLKVVNLGETILPALNIPCLQKVHFHDDVIPRGFAFDGEGVQGKGCKTPLGNGNTFELIQTPEKMAQYVGKDDDGSWWFDKEPHLPMEILNFVWIAGESSFKEKYQASLDKQLENVIEGKDTLRKYFVKNHLREEDQVNFDPTLNNQDEEGKLFQVKRDLYRLPHLFIDRLALMYKINSQSTCERINLLHQERIINIEAKQKLIWLISTITLQRLQVYSHYRSQREFMNPLLHPFTIKKPELAQREFALNPKALKDLTEIYKILIPFYHAINNHLKENQNHLYKENLYDENPITLGKIAARLLQYEKAKKYYRAAKEANPKDPNIFDTIGVVCFHLGQYEEALMNHMESTELRKAFLQDKHPYLAASLNNVGCTLGQLGRYEDALKHQMEALFLLKNLLRDKHLVTDKRSLRLISNILDSFGSTLRQLGNHKEALKYQKKALDLCRDLLGDRHPAVPQSLNSIGLTLEALGRYEEALNYQIKALKFWRIIRGESHPDVATSLDNAGAALGKFGKYEEALNYQIKALKLRKTLLGHSHPDVASSLDNVGCTLGWLGEYKKALNYQMEALELRKILLRESHPDVATSLSNVGCALEDLGKYEEALNYQMKALELRKTILGNEHPSVATSLSNVGCTLES